MRLMHGLLVVAVVAASGCGQAVRPLATAPAGQGAAAAGLVDWAARWWRHDRDKFDAHDLNRDGFLTPDELPDLPPEGFAALDADQDGRLSFAEATAQAPSVQARVKVALDFAAAGADASSGVDVGDTPGSTGMTIGAPGESLVSPIGPDQLGLDPIVFVPGYLDLAFYFGPLEQRARALGRDVTYLELFPNVGDIRIAAKMLHAQVERVRQRTHAMKVDLLAHSEGGLISRYYLQALGGTAQVNRLVTLATPNHGTILGYLGPGLGATQMEPGSSFLKALNSPDQAPPGVKVTSVRAGLDEIILPHSSPILAGAQNDLVPIAEHASIFVLPKAMAFALSGLTR